MAHVNLLLKCKKQKKFKCLLYCLLWWFSAQFMWELDTCPSLTITHNAVILSGDIMKDTPTDTHTSTDILRRSFKKSPKHHPSPGLHQWKMH